MTDCGIMESLIKRVASLSSSHTIAHCGRVRLCDSTAVSVSGPAACPPGHLGDPGVPCLLPCEVLLSVVRGQAHDPANERQARSPRRVSVVSRAAGMSRLCRTRGEHLTEAGSPQSVISQAFQRRGKRVFRDAAASLGAPWVSALASDPRLHPRVAYGVSVMPS